MIADEKSEKKPHPRTRALKGRICHEGKHTMGAPRAQRLISVEWQHEFASCALPVIVLKFALDSEWIEIRIRMSQDPTQISRFCTVHKHISWHKPIAASLQEAQTAVL
jgi:hypothetical protein